MSITLGGNQLSLTPPEAPSLTVSVQCITPADFNPVLTGTFDRVNFNKIGAFTIGGGGDTGPSRTPVIIIR